MIVLKVVLRKSLGLTYLLRAKALGIYELIKVIIIMKGENLIFVVFEIMMTCL